MTSNEINFDIPFTPIEDFALSSDGSIRQVCSNSRLDQVTPVFSVGFRFLSPGTRPRHSRPENPLGRFGNPRA